MYVVLFSSLLLLRHLIGALGSSLVDTRRCACRHRKKKKDGKKKRQRTMPARNRSNSPNLLCVRTSMPFLLSSTSNCECRYTLYIYIYIIEKGNKEKTTRERRLERRRYFYSLELFTFIFLLIDEERKFSLYSPFLLLLFSFLVISSSSSSASPFFCCCCRCSNNNRRCCSFDCVSLYFEEKEMNKHRVTTRKHKLEKHLCVSTCIHSHIE